MRHGIMRCDAGTWGGRTEFVFPTSIVPPFVLLLGRQAVFTHVVFHFQRILLLKMTRGLRGPFNQRSARRHCDQCRRDS